jgi:propionyl-CoA carboxylase beta chain
MGPRGAAEIIFKREIADADDPAAMLQSKEDEYRERFANPFSAAERGYIDDIIMPRNTRPRLIRGLKLLANKVESLPHKKHGNIPL